MQTMPPQSVAPAAPEKTTAPSSPEYLAHRLIAEPRPASTEHQAVLERLHAARVRYRETRSRARRAAQALFAALLVIPALGFMPLFPEVGVPILLGSLRLLAMEFEWAVRAYAALAWRWSRARRWLSARSRVTQGLLALLSIALVVGPTYLLMQ